MLAEEEGLRHIDVNVPEILGARNNGVIIRLELQHQARAILILATTN